MVFYSAWHKLPPVFCLLVFSPLLLRELQRLAQNKTEHCSYVVHKVVLLSVHDCINAGSGKVSVVKHNVELVRTLSFTAAGLRGMLTCDIGITSMHFFALSINQSVNISCRWDTSGGGSRQ